MKRRNIDSAKLRRTLKKNRMSEGFCSSSLIYLKILFVWAFVMMADFLLDFRFEYFWPSWLLLRSIYDSFRYQGVAFSVFFVCVTVTSDMICFIFIPVQWLFFLAGTCVWVQYVWHADRGVCLPTVTLWLLFIYVEASVRLKELKTLPFTLDLCRPFAAHCIGYPVVTLGFGVKTYVSYRLRWRKQKEVAKENEIYSQLLREALPVEQNRVTDGSVEFDQQKYLSNLSSEDVISNGLARCHPGSLSFHNATQNSSGHNLSALAASSMLLSSSSNSSSAYFASSAATANFTSLTQQVNNGNLPPQPPNTTSTSSRLTKNLHNNNSNISVNNSINNVNVSNNGNFMVGGNQDTPATSTSFSTSALFNMVPKNNLNFNNSANLTPYNQQQRKYVHSTSDSAAVVSQHGHWLHSSLSENGALVVSGANPGPSGTVAGKRSNGLLYSDLDPSAPTSTALVNSGSQQTSPSIFGWFLRFFFGAQSGGSSAGGAGSRREYDFWPGGVDPSRSVAVSSSAQSWPSAGSYVGPDGATRDSDDESRASKDSRDSGGKFGAGGPGAGGSPTETGRKTSGSGSGFKYQTQQTTKCRRRNQAPALQGSNSGQGGPQFGQGGSQSVGSYCPSTSQYQSSASAAAFANNVIAILTTVTTTAVNTTTTTTTVGMTQGQAHSQALSSSSSTPNAKDLNCLPQQQKDKVQDKDLYSHLESDIEKLKSELRASKNREQELRRQLSEATNSEKTSKSDLQQLKQQHEQLQTKFQNLMKARQQDKENVSTLEKRVCEEQKLKNQLEQLLKQEKKQHKKLEDANQATNKSANVASSTAKPDCTETCKQRRRDLDNQLKQIRREYQQKDEQLNQFESELRMLRQYKESNNVDVMMSALSVMQDKNQHLEVTLTAETRIKLDLFAALGDAKRQLEITNAQLAKKELELDDHRRRLSQMTSNGMLYNGGAGNSPLTPPPSVPPVSAGASILEQSNFDVMTPQLFSTSSYVNSMNRMFDDYNSMSFVPIQNSASGSAGANSGDQGTPLRYTPPRSCTSSR